MTANKRGTDLKAGRVQALAETFSVNESVFVLLLGIRFLNRTDGSLSLMLHHLRPKLTPGSTIQRAREGKINYDFLCETSFNDDVMKPEIKGSNVLVLEAWEKCILFVVPFPTRAASFPF